MSEAVSDTVVEIIAAVVWRTRQTYELMFEHQELPEWTNLQDSDRDFFRYQVREIIGGKPVQMIHAKSVERYKKLGWDWGCDLRVREKRAPYVAEWAMIGRDMQTLEQSRYSLTLAMYKTITESQERTNIRSES